MLLPRFYVKPLVIITVKGEVFNASGIFGENGAGARQPATNHCRDRGLNGRDR